MTCKLPKTYLRFVLEDDRIQDKLLSEFRDLGVDEYWLKGQSKCGSLIRHECNGCEFRTVYLGYEPPLNEFYQELCAKKGLFDLIAAHQLRPELSVVVYADESMPAIHFDAALLKKLSELEVEIDVDIILCEA